MSNELSVICDVSNNASNAKGWVSSAEVMEAESAMNSMMCRACFSINQFLKKKLTVACSKFRVI